MQNLPNSTILALTITGGKLDEVKNLLTKGFDPNSKTEKGMSMLMLSLHKKDLKIFETLLKFKANPNTTESGIPIITIAIFNGDFDFVKALIKHKANVNMLDKFGASPFFYATKEGNLEMQELLLEHNGIIILDLEKAEKCMSLTIKNNIEKLLKSRKEGSTTLLHKLAKSNEEHDYSTLESMLIFFDNHEILDTKADMKYSVKITENESQLRTISNVTPLYLAVNSGNLKTTTLLVNLGANVDISTTTITSEDKKEDFYSIFELALYKASQAEKIESSQVENAFKILKIIADKAQFPQSERFKSKITKDFEMLPEIIQNLLVEKFHKDISLDLILQVPSLKPLTNTLTPLNLKQTTTRTI